jgi:putative transposase
MLNVVDEFTRECLAIRVGRKLKAADVIDALSDLFILCGVPGHIRSDNGPELAAIAVKDWISGGGARTAFIEPGSPWENGYVVSFYGKLRDELLNAEVFNTLAEAEVLIEQWRRHYNTLRPHSSLRYRPPAPEVVPTARSIPPSSSGPAQPRPPPLCSTKISPGTRGGASQIVGHGPSLWRPGERICSASEGQPVQPGECQWLSGTPW